MSDGNQRKAGAIFSYIYIIINTIIQLFYTPFLIRTLGQSEYGLYALVSSIIGYLSVLDFGFGNAIVVYTAKYRAEEKYDDEKRLHGMFKLVFTIIGSIATLLGLILFFNIDKIFGNSMTSIELHKMKIMMLILSFNLFLSFSFSIYSSIIGAYEKFVFQKVMAIIHSILKPVLMLPFLFLGYKSITMSIVLTLINIVFLFSNYIYCQKKLKVKTKFIGFDKKLFRTILGYSVWIFLGIIVDKVNWSLDNFILGAVSGTIAVSVYSVASTLNQLFINLSTSISGVLLPKMSQLVAMHVSPNELTNEMIKVGRIQNYIIFLMCSGLVLFGKQFIALWLGTGYEESYYVALLLIIPVCFPLIQNLGLSIMQAMNKYRFKSISTAIMAIFNIIISVFLAKKWGAIGAAMGTSISLIICNIILINIYYYFVIKLDIIKFWRKIAKQTLPLLIPLIIIVLLINATNLHGLVGFIIYVVLYTILYCLVAYFISMNSYEKEFVKNFIKKFSIKRGI